MTCYLLVKSKNVQQEHYETVSRDARRRAAELRKAGFRVYVSAMGPQVTAVGIVRMTMITIDHEGREIPAPANMVNL
jgi:hypothetical protein